MEKIAIDLLWLRPGKVGGTESYIRNLLDSFRKLNEDYHFVLLTSKDNAETFRHYEEDPRFEILVAKIENANIGRRIIWQMFCQNHLLRKHHLKYCFVPVYCRPFFNGGITYINAIMDLQAWHYPQYHPFYEVAYSKLCWYADAWFSKRIAVISNWVKEDIVEKLPVKPEKVEAIYIPVSMDKGDVADIDALREKYGVGEDYYYTVCQLIPHKNLETLILVMEEIKKRDLPMPKQLVVTGVRGSSEQKIRELLKQKGLEKNVILTGFLTNGERNAWYKYCRAFLFPSIFEGFGMPPIEAMLWGKPVVTTKCACIPEVTQQKADYVDDPKDVGEWIKVMSRCKDRSREVDFSLYDGEMLSKKYLNFLYEGFFGHGH